MSNLSFIDPNDVLWELNNEKAKSFIPAILYVGILMLIGTFGNIIVLYFYGFKTKPTPSTGFIVALAVFDIISCVVGMPMEIADLRFYFNFKSMAACKTLRVVTYFASIGSGLTLVIIAIDRYRRICKPFERQLKRKHVKTACVVIGILAAAFSWPAAVFNKVEEVDIESLHNITVKGHDCTLTKNSSFKTYILVFKLIYAVAFVLITGILSVLYTFVGKQLYRHKKFRFYVAKKRARTTRIKINEEPNALPEEGLLHMTGDGAPSSEVFGDPPDASEPIVDLREFVTNDLPGLENAQPESELTVVNRVTAETDQAGLPNKSKSLKSVTICDPSYNQIFDIEPRGERLPRPISAQNGILERKYEDLQRQEDLKEQSDLSLIEQYDPDGLHLDRTRPISASSFATFSTRPSSATTSNAEDKPIYPEHLGVDNDYDIMFRPIQEENREEISQTFNDNESPDFVLENIDEAKDKKENVIKRHPVIPVLETEKTYISIPDETTGSNVDLKAEINTAKVDQRPLSQTSSETKSSKASSRLKRFKRNAITPVSTFESSTISSTVTDVTLTSSVASRASTVKRFKRLFKQTGKTDTDTDNIKDLRTKMLDINTVKYTMIMITVTVVFVLSFMPYLALVIWRFYEEEHETEVMSDTELLLFQIGMRSIFLQSSLNPIIYGGFNSKFRAFFYTTFCACCASKRKRRSRIKKTCDQSDSTSGS